MLIFLIHGEDNIKSYERLLKFVDAAKKRSWEVVYLNDSSLKLSENLSSTALFGEERFFVHKDCKKLVKSDFDWLNKNCKNYPGNLVLYSDSEVPKTTISKLPKDIKIEDFKLPKLIWQLLDSFYPGNCKNFLKLLHETEKTEAIELIFGLLAKQVRDIYWVKVDSDSLSYPSWRLSKLKGMANKFTKELLEEIISDLADADVKSKTTNFEMISLLDLIAINRLNKL